MRRPLVPLFMGVFLVPGCGPDKGATDTGGPAGAAAEEGGQDSPADSEDCSTNFDKDCDGYNVVDDCDDEDPNTHPGGTEVCDPEGADEDCDGLVNGDDDVQTWQRYRDADGDGYGDPAVREQRCEEDEPGWLRNFRDCDDTDPETYPGAPDLCGDGVDQDCDGEDGVDDDGDGYASVASGGTDCDDTDNDISPRAREVCDNFGVDEDCDGLVNDDDPSVHGGDDFYEDIDRDGYGSGLTTVLTSCEPVSGYSPTNDDCDDADPQVYPGAFERCGDGQVKNCHLTEDEATAACQLQPGEYALADMGVALSSSTLTGSIGSSVALGGDMDGDGLADLAVGAPDFAGAPGMIWLLRGGAFDGRRDLDRADAVVTGALADDRAGASLDFAGDLNGDGLADLSVAAPGYDDGVTLGATWVLFGPITGAPSLASEGVQLGGGEETGVYALSSGGDLDGDGLSDLASGGNASGEIAFYLGDTVAALEGSGTALVWEDADAILTGEDTSDAAGTALQLGGDIDGDGADDLAISAPYANRPDTDAGGVYLLYRTPDGAVSLGSAEAEVGGDGANALIGQSVSIRGDTNADGYFDVAIGAMYDPHPRKDVGAAFLMLGPLTGKVTVALPDARVNGLVAGEFACGAVSIGGDLNGDGYADLVTSNPDNRTWWRRLNAFVGVFYGPVSGSHDVDDGDLLLESLYGKDGVGRDLSMGGDFDGDGYQELLLSREPHSTRLGVDTVSWLVRGGGPDGVGY